jgi:hypothetical protein
MENTTFIKTDNNLIVNETCIRWVSKMNECLYICTDNDGCSRNPEYGDKHRVCKITNPHSYNKLNAFFDAKN